MGFFDRFRKRVTEVAEGADVEELTAEENTDEAAEALAEKGRIEAERAAAEANAAENSCGGAP